MERTQIYLTAKQKEELQKLAKEKGTSMAELIREAILEYIAKNKDDFINKITNTNGIWADRNDITDSDAYINEMRKNWIIKNTDMEEK